jgi:hypothetical protein
MSGYNLKRASNASGRGPGFLMGIVECNSKNSRGIIRDANIVFSLFLHFSYLTSLFLPVNNEKVTKIAWI